MTSPRFNTEIQFLFRDLFPLDNNSFFSGQGYYVIIYFTFFVGKQDRRFQIFAVHQFNFLAAGAFVNDNGDIGVT